MASDCSLTDKTIMKKILIGISAIVLLASCNDTVISKPKNLIDEDKMVDIFYDLSLLEAIKAQNPYSPQNQSINPKQFIYKKYKIDSLQFAQNNQYYVSQIDKYKKMYEKVGERIEKEKKKNDSLFRASGVKTEPKTPVSDAPQIQ